MVCYIIPLRKFCFLLASDSVFGISEFCKRFLSMSISISNNFTSASILFTNCQVDILKRFLFTILFFLCFNVAIYLFFSFPGCAIYKSSTKSFCCSLLSQHFGFSLAVVSVIDSLNCCWSPYTAVYSECVGALVLNISFTYSWHCNEQYVPIH